MQHSAYKILISPFHLLANRSKKKDDLTTAMLAKTNKSNFQNGPSFFVNKFISHSHKLYNCRCALGTGIAETVKLWAMGWMAEFRFQAG
jgi:hypothetical protein